MTPRRVVLLSLLLTLLVVATFCQERANAPSKSQASTGYWKNWFHRVAKTQAAQPHWITPLFTTTPRLEQEFRYDISGQQKPGGATIDDFGGGKGLEFIPAERLELIVGVPAYLDHHPNGALDGFGDENFLAKYRIASADESHGNYIATVFLGASVPSGSAANSSGVAIVTPTFAFGKGWKNFDVQDTLGISLPTGDTSRLGRPILFNTAFQYRILRRLWPELEINGTAWPDGANTGKKQVFLTPGMVVGKLPIWRRLGFTIGAGDQIAATSFHTYNHQWILSLRAPF